jgi:N-acetyl-gamma-glutamyl-phosphate reductase
MRKTFKTGIIGATGYTGIELIRLLSSHPNVDIAYASSETYAGQTIGEVYPHLYGLPLILQKLDLETIKQTCDVVFIALPHGHAITIAQTLADTNIKVIDLGADFRLQDPETYQTFYAEAPPSSNLLANSLYGLPEIHKKNNYTTPSIIANPGCYPTAAILGAAPLLINDFISLDFIVLDGKSGVSGAGRGLAVGTHYCEVAENFKAYKVAGTHRHTPEIEQIFSQLAGKAVNVNFTPHLVPMVRGLFMTGYYRVKNNVSLADIRKAYEQYYMGTTFVRICPEHTLPETAHVRGSNAINIGINFNFSTQTVIITSIIDNLIKGASGQAIQNMNLLFGLAEDTGLDALSAYP